MNDQFDDAEPLNPFALARVEAPAGGAVSAMQKREETEVFSMVMMAKRFPRVQAEAMDRILIAFQRPTLAEQAQYQFARGGQDIVGPSIRSAEAIAQEWGNIDTGWREISRGIGPEPKRVPYSEVQAYAIDLQSTTRKALTFIVPHWRDTRSGGYAIKEERDIYELCANMAQRRLRACILALIPGDVVEQAMNQATATLKAKADTSPEAMKKMLEAFAHWGVTQEHFEKRIQRKLDSITAAQVVGLKRIYASLRDEMSRPQDWFDMPEPEKKPDAGGATTLADIKEKAAAPAPAAAPATDLAGTPVADKKDDGPKIPEPDVLINSMKKAKSMDALGVHADWIRFYPEEATKLRLTEVYEARKTELAK